MNIFDQTHSVFKRHIATEPHYHVAVSLWALHTHVYRKFGVTPRLALLSPVPNCGKTTVLSILQKLVWEQEYFVDPTPASLYRSSAGSTLLLDEVDNLRVERGMRTMLNSGHKSGGAVPRVMGKHLVLWPTFGPVALAAIGVLPTSLMSRSIIVRMHRADPKMKFMRFDEKNILQIQELHDIKCEVLRWADKVQLNTDPMIPASLGRVADNWRVLLAIADSFGRGDMARDAASKIIGEHQSPDTKILLLHDIRTVFDDMKTKILPSKLLLEQLLTLEEGEHDWSENKLTPIKLSHILSEFQIKPQNMWWPEQKHRSEQQNLRCYVRQDFELMWRRYVA